MTSPITGPWNDTAFKILERWDPEWSEAVDRMTSNPWMGSLDRKTVELVSLAVNAACTNLKLKERGVTSEGLLKPAHRVMRY